MVARWGCAPPLRPDHGREENAMDRPLTTRFRLRPACARRLDVARRCARRIAPLFLAAVAPCSATAQVGWLII